MCWDRSLLPHHAKMLVLNMLKSEAFHRPVFNQKIPFHCWKLNTVQSPHLPCQKSCRRTKSHALKLRDDNSHIQLAISISSMPPKSIFTATATTVSLPQWKHHKIFKSIHNRVSKKYENLHWNNFQNFFNGKCLPFLLFMKNIAIKSNTAVLD